MHQWLLFEMSKISVEEKPFEVPPKGRGNGSLGEAGFLGAPSGVGPWALPDPCTGLSQPLSSHSCLSCLLFWARLPPAPHPVWGTESSLQEVTLLVEDGTAQGGLEQKPPITSQESWQ